MSGFDNPYAPPAADEVFDPNADGFGYQPSEGLATALRILLGVCVAVLIVNVWSFTAQSELLERAARGRGISLAEANANDERVGLLSVAFLLSLLATGIVWCIWQNRTSKNARALGAAGMEFGPNAWGWFFCPILNLWRPMAVISELWGATMPDYDPLKEDVSGWRGASAPSWLLGGWWLAWILGSIFSRIGSGLVDEKDIGSLISASQWSAVAFGLIAVSGVFAIVLVTMLQKRVQARAAQRRGKPASQTNGLW